MNALSPYAEDQVLIKQEEQLWASLFATSENAVVESAKGFIAQLQEMSQLVEETEEDAKTAISPISAFKEEQSNIQQMDPPPQEEVS